MMYMLWYFLMFRDVFAVRILLEGWRERKMYGLCKCAEFWSGLVGISLVLVVS